MANCWSAIKTCIIKFMDFRGRAARNEFWWFFLFVTLFGLLVALFSSSGVPYVIWKLLTLCLCLRLEQDACTTSGVVGGGNFYV